MSAKKITPQKRVTEYGSDVLICRNNKLFCKLCNIQQDVGRKSSIDCHLKSASHIALAEKSKTFF